MSRTVPSALQTKLDARETSFARCWLIVRKDGTRYGFTDHDAELIVNPDAGGDVTFKPGSGLGAASAVQSTANLSVDNQDVIGIFSSDITAADLEGGLWDYATISPFLVDHQAISDGIIKLPGKGRIGQIELRDYSFTTELRSLADALNQSIGATYSPLCRAQFCDSDCGLTAGSHTVTGTITGNTSSTVFADSSRGEADDYWNGGTLTWTNGNNNGLSMEVKDFVNSSGTITLVMAMPKTISTDTYSLIRGCDKRLTTCVSTYSNGVAFRGEPHMPGESIYKFGGQH